MLFFKKAENIPNLVSISSFLLFRYSKKLLKFADEISEKFELEIKNSGYSGISNNF